MESVRPSDPAGPADRAGLPIRGEGGAAERLHPPGGRQNVYTPLVDEGEYLAFENAPFLEGRGLPGLVAALYDSRSVSREELAELRAFLDEAMGKEGDV